MKRPLITCSAAVFAYSLINMAIPRAHSWPAAPERIIAGFLWYPALILAVLLTLAGLRSLFIRETRNAGLTSILLCAPLLVHSSYLYSLDVAHDRENESDGILNVVAYNLLEYHRLYPDRFHYIGTDETVTADGFTAWLRQRGPAANPQGWLIQLRFRDDQIIDPWGNPLVFALDRNHDDVIDFRGYEVSISGVDPPFANGFNYTDAVAVDSSHYHGEYSHAHIEYK